MHAPFATNTIAAASSGRPARKATGIVDASAKTTANHFRAAPRRVATDDRNHRAAGKDQRKEQVARALHVRLVHQRLDPAPHARTV